MSEMTYGEAIAKMAHDMKEMHKRSDEPTKLIGFDTTLDCLYELQSTIEDSIEGKHSASIVIAKHPLLELVERAIELARADTGKRGNCLLCAHYQRAEDQRVAHECMDRLRRLAELGNCPLTKDEVDNLERFI